MHVYYRPPLMVKATEPFFSRISLPQFTCYATVGWQEEFEGQSRNEYRRNGKFSQWRHQTSEVKWLAETFKGCCSRSNTSWHAAHVQNDRQGNWKIFLLVRFGRSDLWKGGGQFLLHRPGELVKKSWIKLSFFWKIHYISLNRRY